MAFSTGVKPLEELVSLVKVYAIQHYVKDSWDIVIETMTDPKIESVLIGANAATEQGAVYAMKRYLRHYHAVFQDIRGEVDVKKSWPN